MNVKHIFRHTKMNKRLGKRVCAVLMSIVMLITVVPGGIWFVNAAEPFTEQYSKVTDAATLHSWKQAFGAEINNTFNAGKVWGDKSVFASAAELNTALSGELPTGTTITAKDEKDMFVALSAIASNKEVVGYSTIPTDTMLVLDLSNSMSTADVQNMVAATNAALTRLYELNPNNRVGVVLYSGESVYRLREDATPNYWGNYSWDDYEEVYTLDSSATVLLPLAQYTATNTTTVGSGQSAQTVKQYVTYVAGTYNSSAAIQVASGVAQGGESFSNAVAVGGATYMQSGLWKAWKQFESADTVIEGGMQDGTKRMPVMVLMSDGAPTLFANDYTNVGDADRGSGGSGSATASNAFLTQLTASWIKAQMAKEYGRAALFYTLGLGVGDNVVATSVLDPYNSMDAMTGYWEDYLDESVPAGSNVVITEDLSVVKNADVTTKNYVNQYFPAADTAGLVTAFEQIVDQIIIQSRYYPTLAETGDYELDGYITFTDELGKHMKVKDIKGLVAEGKLYTGQALAKAVIQDNVFGNIANGNMDNLNANGTAFLQAVETRFGCNSDQAKTVIREAVLSGQISYTADSYSNYIGWFSDENGKFVSFWDGTHVDVTAAPAGAKYMSRSYGFIGTVGSVAEYNETDMMHIVVQVREEIPAQSEEVGHQTVIYKIPGALVPMVTYEVDFEGTSYENAQNITLQVTGDTAPIRLLFEVGLADDVNTLNMVEKFGTDYGHINADGTYDFYSNWWHIHDSADTEEEIENPNYHDTTWLTFEPALENERYYYAADAEILDADGNPVSAIVQGGTYYHALLGFERTGIGNGARKVTKLEPIHENTLQYAVMQDEKLIIPAGHIYQMVGSLRKEKADNETPIQGGYTDTLNYSAYAVVQHGDYQINSYLGNNGKLTVTPETGIKLTKQIDTVIPGTATDNFSFIIDFANDADLAGLQVVNGEGEIIAETRYTVDSADKVLTINGVANGETVYAVGLAAGVSYTITEKAHGDYLVKHTVVDGTQKADLTYSGTTVSTRIADVTFVNTARTYGGLVIQKELTHPFAAGSTEAAAVENVDFDVQVNLGMAYADAHITTSKGTLTADENGVIAFTLKADEGISIRDLETNTAFTVAEVGLTDGFTNLNTATELQGAIVQDQNSTVTLRNKYQPENAPTDIVSVVGEKTMVGRDWLDTDRFAFKLQYLNEQYQWVDLGSDTVYGTDAAKTFDLTTAFGGFRFDAVGTYQFRVIEVWDQTGGVTYDTTVRYFHVTVTDTDVNGALEIADVQVTAPTTLNVQSGHYTVKADFENRYAPLGNAAITIHVTKELVNTTNVARDKAGFVFGLYDGNNLIAQSTETNAAGQAILQMVYPATLLVDQEGNRVGSKEFTYTLKEIVPEDSEKAEGIVYNTTTSYNLTVQLIDNLDGSISAKVYRAGESVDTADQIYGDTATETLTVQNQYVLTPATVAFNGEKELNGRKMQAGEFSFQLYQTDDTFTVAAGATPVKTATNQNQVGTDLDSISISGVQLDTAGNHYFVLKENTSTTFTNGTFDRHEYHITVTVGKQDGAAALEVTKIAYDKLDADGAIVESNHDTTEEYMRVSFSNTYTPTPIPLDINGIKTLEGRDLVDDEFTFDLYKVTDDTFNLQTAILEESAPAVKAAGETFGRITFDTLYLSTAGTYYYVVKEDTSAALPGIQYDSTIYRITVQVQQNDDGTLYIANRTVTDGEGNAVTGDMVFANQFVPAPLMTDVGGVKTLVGRDMIASEFDFAISEATLQPDGTLLVSDVVLDTVHNEGDGEISDLTFSVRLPVAGSYYYVIREVAENAGGITYDTAQYVVRIDASVDAEARVQKDAEEYFLFDAATNEIGASAEKIQFNNTYVAAQTKVTLCGLKKLTGRDLAAGEFTFHLYLADAAYAYDGEPILTAKNDADGIFTFEDMFFATTGEWYFVIKEDATDKLENVTYDESVYGVKVTVTDNGEGQLQAVTTFVKGDADATIVLFENKYTAPKPVQPEKPDVPKTGDTFNRFMWQTLLAIGVLGLLASLKKRKANAE